MKKLFLFLAAFLLATVMNLHADKANIDLTSGHTTSGQSLVTYDLDANISIDIACSQANISNDGRDGTSFEPAGSITVNAAGGCTITSVTLECVPYHCPDYSECGFLSGSSTPGISNISQYSFFSGSATQVVWTFKNMEASCILSKASVTYTKPDMDTLYLNTGGNTLWNQDGAKFSVWYWNDGEAGEFTDFLAPAIGETDIYRAIIPKKDSVIFVRHAATADVPTWDNKLNQTKSDEVDLEIGNIMVITGWEPADREWDWYTPKQAPDTLDYLHFVSLKAGGSVKMSKQGTPAEPSLEYSKDNRKSWSKFDIANGTTFDNVGDTIWFRAGKNGVAGTNATISGSVQNYFYFAFGENDSIAAGGNIMSLLDGTCAQKSVPDAGLCYLFYNAKQLIFAPELPATTLANSCYYWMFNNCTSLTTAPELPATTIATSCYASMFRGCTKLENGPTSLPAAVLVGSCYSNMFLNCAKLKNAPAMNVTTLANMCCSAMFQGCSNLIVDSYTGECDGVEMQFNHEGEAPSQWNSDMFEGCHGTITKPTIGGHYCIKEYKEPDMHDFLYFVGLNGNDTVHLDKMRAESASTFEYSMDRKTWTQVTWTYASQTRKKGNPIALNQGDTVFFRAKGVDGKNATVGTNNAYFTFFFGVDDSIAVGGNIMSLYDATCEQDTMTEYGFYWLFYQIKNLVSASELKLPAKKLAENCYESMFDYCTALKSAPTISAEIVAKKSCYYMFRGCTSLTTAPALPATKMAENCYQQMFYGCTALTQVPELKADSLAKICYYGMFDGCTSLQVDTCVGGNCDGVKFAPTTIGDEPANWGKKMFDGCHGAYANKIQLGGHYCIKEYKEIVCQIGTKEYESIAAAMAEVKAGETIQVLKDIQLDAVIDVTSSTPACTLDLNGHILDGSALTGDDASLLYNASTLYIIDSNPTATHAAPFDTIQGAIMTGGKGWKSGKYYYGGAIYSQGTDLHVDGVAFVANTATNGGAIYTNQTPLTCTNCCFINATQSVGAVYSYSATSTITNCSFYGNNSTDHSSAVACNGGTCSIDSCVIQGNSAKNGTIKVCNQASVTITNTTITDNTSTSYPGGIGVWDGSLTLGDGTVITNNTSDANFPCGGIYVWNQSDYNNSITLSGKVIIKDNTSNGQPANLCLSGDPLCDEITLNGLSAGSEIHVCTMINDVVTPATFAANATEADLQYFKSDNGFDIVRENTNLMTKDTHDYLHLVSLKDNGTVRLDKKATIETLADLTATFEYSKDRKNWTEYTWGDWISSVATGAAIALNQGDTVFFRAKGENGKNATMGYSFNAYFRFAFGADDSIAAGGNTMSLYDAKCEQDTMTAGGFYNLFSTNPSLVSVSELKWPAKKLAEDCYCTMFEKCTSLTTAPELPATTLAPYCYNGMFKDCSALTQAPELNATTLAYQCCYQMFQNCTALTVAPALPATKMAERCYASMFDGCTSLTVAPELKADSLANLCYYKMFSGCTSLQVDTCADGSCDGVKLEPTHSGTGEPTSWSKKMFDGCHGAYTNIKLGGHYCIKEFIPDTIKGIELTPVDTVYDGQNHYIQVNGTIAGDEVTYSTDSATWAQDTIKLKNVSDTTIFVRIQRTDHYDWYGKSSIKIAKKELTVEGTTVKEKDYDATTYAQITTGTLKGVIGSDDVKVDTKGEFSDKNVGKDKDVSVVYLLCGEQAGNYTIESATVKGTIVPLGVFVDDSEVEDKVYDGNTNAVVQAGTLDGVYGSDDVQIESATGTFADANAGKDKEVSINYTLKGADANNYKVIPYEYSASITKRELTLESADLTKEYDGTPLTAEGTTIKATGYVEGECLKYSLLGSQTMVGESPNFFDYSDSETALVTNYEVTAIYGTLEVIPSTELITITANSDSKVYDGTPLTNSGFIVSGALGAGDKVDDVVIEGTVTLIGSAPNTIKGYKIYHGQDDEVTSYYTNVQVVNGLLTISDTASTCAEANQIPDKIAVGLAPVMVTYVNGAYTYVQDATGCALLYTDNYGLHAGDLVSGIQGVSIPTEGGMPRIKPTKQVDQLTVIPGEAPQPVKMNEAPSIEAIHQYVRYEDLTITDGLAADGILFPYLSCNALWLNTTPMVINNAFGSTFSLESNQRYDIVATIAVDNNQMQLYPVLFSFHTDTQLNSVYGNGNSVEKYILNGQLYIRVNGVLYNASGARVQ